MFFFDCEVECWDDFMRCLKVYILRLEVSFVDVFFNYLVVVFMGKDAIEKFGLLEILGEILGAVTVFGGGVVYGDPCLAEFGVRALLSSDNVEVVIKDVGFFFW